MQRYLLCPGWIRSKHDNDDHFISAPQLARLYGVRMNDCLVDDPVNPYGLTGIDTTHLIRLGPRYYGDYKQHLADALEAEEK